MSYNTNQKEIDWVKFKKDVENKQRDINSLFAKRPALITIILEGFNNKEAKVKWLLENGVDADICNDQGISPLIYAVDRGDIYGI